MSRRVLSSDEQAVAAALGPLARIGEPIGPQTTYRVGGAAAITVTVGARGDLEQISQALQGRDVPVFVLGAGSNLLIADGGVGGLCIQLGEQLGSLSIEAEELQICAGAALAYPQLARRAVAAGLSGMEWAVGIPGSVGGAVAMNAGGHGAETRERLVSASLYRVGIGKWREASPAELELSYRHSNVAADEVVFDARFSLEADTEQAGEARLSEIVAWRREHQPGGRNGGSVFSNPPGDSAGRLIDAAGLKGHRIGSAVVSDKHANFFLADKDGSADDVYALIEEVRKLVLKRLSIELVPELKTIGFGS